MRFTGDGGEPAVVLERDMEPAEVDLTGLLEDSLTRELLTLPTPEGGGFSVQRQLPGYRVLHCLPERFDSPACPAASVPSPSSLMLHAAWKSLL
jgi:hypothetical protein